MDCTDYKIFINLHILYVVTTIRHKPDKIQTILLIDIVDMIKADIDLNFIIFIYWNASFHLQCQFTMIA